MDKDALTQAMKDSISEVLETMFFMPVDFMCTGNGKDKPADKTEPIAAQLHFSGPVSGCIRLTAPKNLARDISSDFLGIDPDEVAPEDMVGTVKEMINMLAGNTLSLYNPKVVFDMGVPEIISGKDPLNRNIDEYELIRLEIQTLASCMTMVVGYK